MQSAPGRTLLYSALALAALTDASVEAAPVDHPTVQYFEDEQARIGSELAEVASGLEEGLKTDDVRVATRLYAVERAVIDLVGAAEYVKWRSAADKPNARAGLRATLARIYQLQERVQQHAITVLEAVRPGEPQRQHWARRGIDLYRPLFRMGTPEPGQPARTADQALKEMEANYQAKGGKPEDFAYLGRRSLKRLAHGVLAEWVQFGEDRVRFNTNGAKHPVIAMGKSPRGAGSMKIYKDERGVVILAVVSNSSGNYKPGPGSTEGPVQELIDLGVDPAHILVTSIIPEEPELVKLLLKARLLKGNPQLTDADVKTHLKEPMAQVLTTTSPPVRPAMLRPNTRFLGFSVRPQRLQSNMVRLPPLPKVVTRILSGRR